LGNCGDNGDIGHDFVYSSSRFAIIFMLMLRKYQLDIIFLFFAFIIIVWSAFYAVQYFGYDPHSYEWYIVMPFLIFYSVRLLIIRRKIRLADRRRLTGKTMFYWIIMGITLFASYDTPISAKEYWSINVLFVIFTLLLADSYWDFKEISLKRMLFKRDN